MNFRVKNDKPVGPGSYVSPDEIEHMKKIKNQLRHNRPDNLAFGSGNARDKNHYTTEVSRNRAFQGRAGEYHKEDSFAKPSFNASLNKSPSNKNFSPRK